MSRKGNCWNNARVESFYNRIRLHRYAPKPRIASPHILGQFSDLRNRMYCPEQSVVRRIIQRMDDLFAWWRTHSRHLGHRSHLL